MAANKTCKTAAGNTGSGNVVGNWATHGCFPEIGSRSEKTFKKHENLESSGSPDVSWWSNSLSSTENYCFWQKTRETILRDVIMSRHLLFAMWIIFLNLLCFWRKNNTIFRRVQKKVGMTSYGAIHVKMYDFPDGRYINAILKKCYQNCAGM